MYIILGVILHSGHHQQVMSPTRDRLRAILGTPLTVYESKLVDDCWDEKKDGGLKAK